MPKPTDPHAELTTLRKQMEDHVRQLERRIEHTERRHAEYSLAMSYILRCLIDRLERDRGLKAGEFAASLAAARTEWMSHRPTDQIETLLRSGLHSKDMDMLLEFLIQMPPGPSPD